MASQTASERFLARFQRQGRGDPAKPRQLPLVELQGDLFACSDIDADGFCWDCEQAVVDAGLAAMDRIDAERAGQGSGSGVSALVTPTLCAMGGTDTPDSLDE